MSYQPPEYGRYNPGPVFRADGTHRSFRIYDGAYLPSEPILDWRHKFKRPWEGTEEEAIETCRILNAERETLGNRVKSEMTVTSKTQRIWRAQRARSRSTASYSGKTSVAGERFEGYVVQSLFVKCESCGIMINGGEHSCT
jgi:hypothetical protein